MARGPAREGRPESIAPRGLGRHAVAAHHPLGHHLDVPAVPDDDHGAAREQLQLTS